MQSFSAIFFENFERLVYIQSSSDVSSALSISLLPRSAWTSYSSSSLPISPSSTASKLAISALVSRALEPLPRTRFRPRPRFFTPTLFFIRRRLRFLGLIVPSGLYYIFRLPLFIFFLLYFTGARIFYSDSSCCCSCYCMSPNWSSHIKQFQVPLGTLVKFRHLRWAIL